MYNDLKVNNTIQRIGYTIYKVLQHRAIIIVNDAGTSHLHTSLFILVKLFTRKHSLLYPVMNAL